MSNTILLKTNGHKEEYPAAAALSPGHLVTINSSSQVLKHAAAGQRVPVIVAVEDALQGKTVDDAFASGALVPVIVGSKGDLLQVRLQSGQNATMNDGLVSAGDGTFLVGESGSSSVPEGLLYRNTAASTAHTNSTTETLLDKYYSVPANGLRAGDVLHVTAQVIATATNSTDTLTVKLYIGGLAGTAICTSGAVDVADNDICRIEALITIRTIGATGTFVAAGSVGLGVSGTVTDKQFFLGSTAIDTTAAKVIGVGVDWSVASASNSCRLDVLTVELSRQYGQPIMLAAESKDASSAEKLIRARVA